MILWAGGGINISPPRDTLIQPFSRMASDRVSLARWGGGVLLCCLHWPLGFHRTGEGVLITEHTKLSYFSPSELLPYCQAKTKEMGVPLNYLRSKTNARWHVNWRGYGGPVQDLPGTDNALATAYDLKLPPHFDDEDFPRLAENIAYAARVTVRATQA